MMRRRQQAGEPDSTRQQRQQQQANSLHSRAAVARAAANMSPRPEGCCAHNSNENRRGARQEATAAGSAACGVLPRSVDWAALLVSS
jgi:hypothetical protein